VFSITSCGHCARAKAALKKHGIEFVEINLDEFPLRRRDMLSLANSLTVPQVFFHNAHIGGADAVLALAHRGELHRSFKEFIVEEDDGLDERLMEPTESPKDRPIPSPRAEEKFEADGASFDLIHLLQQVRTNLGPKFSGINLVKFFLQLYGLPGSGAVVAANVGDKLLHAGAIFIAEGKHVDKRKGKFRGDATSYCLLSEKWPAALNNFRRWQDRVDDPILVVRSLKSRLDAVLAKHRNDAGLVDYVDAAEDSDFIAFDEASCEIQNLRMQDMEEDLRRAFAINLYNLLTMHAFTKVGIPNSNLGRIDFFKNIGYNIGGQFFSFDILEHGVLRGNRPAPFRLTKPIPSGDQRLRTILRCEPAIHACVSCGAASCPVIRSFTAEAIEEEMLVSAQAFFEQEENCKIDESSNAVTLTKIVSWYQSDFGHSRLDAARKVQTFLRGDKAEKMAQVLNSGSAKIQFADYDWNSNASRSKGYSRLEICAMM